MTRNRWIENAWLRRLAIFVLLWLAVWLFAWLALPPLAKWQLQKVASAELGRTVTVQKIDFKPWSLELTVEGLQVAGAGPDASEPQLAIGRIYANAQIESVLRLAPVIDAVQIDAPSIHLKRLSDGRYDIDDVLDRLRAAPDKPKDKDEGKAARFAVYNIAITNGAFTFVDEPVKRTHELRGLDLAIPFLSNFDAKRAIETEPKLAFTLNGSRFDSAALSTPFAPDRATQAKLAFKDLDLAPYLGYVPAGLPVSMHSGVLDAALKFDFKEGTTTGLRISGDVALKQARLADSRGDDLLAFDALNVSLADVRPLEQVIHLSSVQLSEPKMFVRRNDAGRLNLLPTDPVSGAPAARAAETTDDNKKPDAKAAAPTKREPSKLAVVVDAIGVQGGQISWKDETTDPVAIIKTSELQIKAKGVKWPMSQPATFDGAFVIDGASRLGFKGEATDEVANVQAELEAFPLALVAPYLANTLEPTLGGKLSGQIDIAWAKPALKITGGQVTAENLALTGGKTALASIGRFDIRDVVVDLEAQTLTIASLTAKQPKIGIERDKKGRWMYEEWIKTPGGKAKAAPTVADPQAPPVKPWSVVIAKAAIDGGAVSFADRSGALPVTFDISALDLEVAKYDTAGSGPLPLALSGRISGDRRANPGRFSFKGTFGLKPLSVKGSLAVSAIPVHAFKGYYAGALRNVDLNRAFFDYKGSVQFTSGSAGPSVAISGDTSLEDVRASSSTLTRSRTAGGSDELLRWKALGLRGLQANIVPGKAPVIDVKQTALTDFFARLIVDETGRINLQDLAGSSAAPDAPAPERSGTAADAGARSESGDPASASAPPDAVAEGITTERGPDGVTTTTRPPIFKTAPSSWDNLAQKIGRAQGSDQTGPGTATADTPAEEASANAEVASAPGGSAGQAPVIRFGPVSLVNGKIDFTDNFVKPNYSADLTELTGKLSSFSSVAVDGQSTLADLELRGKAQQTAALEIVGKLNPLAKPIELDIKANMTDLDLPPLSPYSVRYAGHSIERGKLSMQVEYRVKPDGQLTATNKLVLKQLRFGDAVDGAPASLPVKLAVALLADRDGIIDVDLPLTGSLNDPQFSIGPLIWKALGNLIVKAVTAPFTLLTGGFGGSSDASNLTFDAGSATLTDDSRTTLEKVAKALADRPRLKMTVTGSASLDEEREAFKRQRLRQLMQAEKRRKIASGGKDAADVAPVTDAEYPQLLTQVYERADIKKPRNFVGFAKDIPVTDMEKLLLADISVGPADMRELAVDRGAAVRTFLLDKKVPADRLFLGDAKTGAEGKDWKPSAGLKLETN